MRQFVVVGHDAPTDDDFPLSDLPGSAGRLDLLARSVLASLLTSHGVRSDARVHLVLADALTVTVDGESVRSLHPDERSTAALLRSTLAEHEEAIGRIPVETSPGITLTRGGLAECLTDLDAAGPVYRLGADGTPTADVEAPTDPVFVLSDHRDFTDTERELLADRAHGAISLGPAAVHTDQAIAVTHNWLDRAGDERW
jgi:tRNA (pseudouridine54-N1)-methyltransferase